MASDGGIIESGVGAGAGSSGAAPRALRRTPSNQFGAPLEGCRRSTNSTRQFLSDLLAALPEHVDVCLSPELEEELRG